MANEKVIKKRNATNSVLKLLIEHQAEALSIRQISKLQKINYKSAYIAVKTLEKEKIISVNAQGNNSKCMFNRNFNERVFAVEYERREELLKNANFSVMYNDLKKINQDFILLLFGSYAKGTQHKNSDIDLMLISEDEKLIERELNLLPLNIHLIPLTKKEFSIMYIRKSFSVVSEAIKKNIILIGIEDYYRLVENAQQSND
jgi:predicted nucleotidyltransferase